MTIETLAQLFIDEAVEAIEFIHAEAGDRGLTWGQTDALGNTRSELREILSILSEYHEDLPALEAVQWVGERLEPTVENAVFDSVLCAYRK